MLQMHRFTLFGLTIAFGLLSLVHSILILESTSSALTAATLTLGVSATAASAAATAAAFAGLGALALAGVLVATQAASRSGKRSAPSCLPANFNNPDLFLTLAASSDKLGCGMRLVCELESTPDEVLTNEERLILGIFGRSPKPVSFDQLDSPKSGFQYAAFVGAKASNPNECATIFNKCPFDRVTMIKAFNRNSTNGL